MHDEETRTAHGLTTDGPMRDIQRLGVLSWCFSAVEIDHLSRLQLRHRERPEALDLPIEESRLLFARWLVEHARIGDGELSQERAGTANNTRQPMPIAETATRHRDRVQLPEHAKSLGWHLRPLRHLARICRGIARSARRRDEAGNVPYVPGEYATWYHGPWDLYSSPRALTTAQLLQLGYWYVR